MAETPIEWTHYTFNVVWGCQRVSEGCKFCYADTLASRFGYDLWGPAASRRSFGPDYWARPLRWNALAQEEGYPRNVFCSSMADVFEDHEVVAQEREKLWPLIDQTSWLNWLLLTKRPQNVWGMIPNAWQYESSPRNVWLGTSVENQRRADERIPFLLNIDIPVSVCFLSCEPLLGPLDLRSYLPHLQWVIVGGESGPHARPMAVEWVRDLRDQCLEAGVSFFFKQWGGRTHASGGRLLDGRVWDEMPGMVGEQ